MYKIETSNDIGNIEINGKVYTLDLSDDAMARFSEGSEYLEQMQQRLNSVTMNNFDKAKEFTRDLINGILIGNPFDDIYEGQGRSTAKTVMLIPKLLKAYTDIAGESGKALK